MGAQAKLPGTLPTPQQAKAAIRVCREEVRQKRNVVEGMKSRVSAAKDEEKAALAELEEAEVDLLASDEKSREEVDADGRHHKACARARRARLDLGKVGATLALAAKELEGALGRLAVAREDLEAVREGRRK